MAIHFDFIVDDVDAENIFHAIRNDALSRDELIMDMMHKDISDEYRESMIAAYRESKDYLLGLLKLMKNTRVSDGESK